MTDEHPVTRETTEARQAFRVVWPYCSIISSTTVYGQDSYVDWELFIEDSSGDHGEHDAGDREGVEAGKSDTMEHDDQDMDRLQEATEKLMVMDGEAMDSS